MNKNVFLFFSLLLVLPPSAFAESLFAPVDKSAESGELVVADAAPLSSDEMETLRGGFVDPSGLVYRFAVDVKTALNGAEIFTRSLVVAPVVPNGALQAVATANLLPQNIPDGVVLKMVGNGRGVTVTDAAGQSTTVLNQTAQGAPASIIMNTADGRAISQSVNATLTLPNMATIMSFVHTTTGGAAFAQHAALRSIGF